jgi:thiol-disulfide isomerase/thioredoxin
MNVTHKTIEITDANFEEMVLKSDKPVIIDYWATWCGPCKMLSPIVEELAGEMEGQAVFGKMDVQKKHDGHQVWRVCIADPHDLQGWQEGGSPHRRAHQGQDQGKSAAVFVIG